MESRINKLKEKYWSGETSIDEEKELRKYFEQNPSLSKEGGYHSAVSHKQKEVSEMAFSHPGKKNRQTWFSAAAAILILLTMSIFFIQQDDSQQQFAVEDPTEAYEITKASLMLVSEKLNKGKAYSNELDKINKAKKIIKN